MMIADQDGKSACEEKEKIFPIDTSARLSWELVKITSTLPVEQQRQVLEFAKSLTVHPRTEGLSDR